jgi:carotenoid cleavage dioxygenase
MRVDKLPPVKATLQPSNHPYLNGAWTPQHEEVTATDLDVLEGRIPDDIDGSCINRWADITRLTAMA